MRVPALPLGVGVGDDDVDSGQQLARLHERERVRRAALSQSDAVVPQSAQVDVDSRRVGGARALEKDYN